ncbi:hypothetical protein [Ralstonia phage RSP15]|uniref:hypothetical protein n=1 Tax=Ralstonia phage RSP15 TaxID=1785960 RepID=UPI00074D4338|nr:hypothetical protein BH754_gp210 [Ralstonia phage RSP15]BAU40096.1 hypothetical protein [Ralstonia phage RSP15]
MSTHVLCPYCGQPTYSPDGLLNHIFRNHEEIRVRSIEELEQRMNNLGTSLRDFVRKDLPNSEIPV